MLALISFIQNLPPDSALARDMDTKNEFAEWYGVNKTNAILADIFDLVAAAHTPKGRRAKPYPRPKQHRSIGRGAVPIAEFWKWWNKER